VRNVVSVVGVTAQGAGWTIVAVTGVQMMPWAWIVLQVCTQIIGNGVVPG
jgi:hypothetical protein